MKTKKVVVGTMTAAILSLTLGALPVTFAAGETVQISVGSKEVKPGETFSVDVTLDDIPSAGIQACDFAIQYDNSVITVTSVDAGKLTQTGATEADETSSSLPMFDASIHDDKGYVNLAWSTMLDDSKYWLNGSGVLCTINGTVADDAVDGTKVALKLVPTQRETRPGSGVANSSLKAGYTNGSKVVKYDVATTDGAISIASEGSTGEKVVYGDADLSGKLEISDAAKIMSYTANSEKYPLSEKALDVSDVNQRGDGVNNMDALSVRKRLAQIINELPESYL